MRGIPTRWTTPYWKGDADDPNGKSLCKSALAPRWPDDRQRRPRDRARARRARRRCSRRTGCAGAPPPLRRLRPDGDRRAHLARLRAARVDRRASRRHMSEPLMPTPAPLTPLAGPMHESGFDPSSQPGNTHDWGATLYSVFARLGEKPTSGPPASLGASTGLDFMRSIPDGRLPMGDTLG